MFDSLPFNLPFSLSNLSELLKASERRWRITTEVTFRTPTKISILATSVVRHGVFRWGEETSIVSSYKFARLIVLFNKIAFHPLYRWAVVM